MHQDTLEGEATGMVVRSTGRWVHVSVNGEVVRARIRGRMRLAGLTPTNPAAVGDQVSLHIGRDGVGTITDVHERTNALARRAAGRRVGRHQVLVSNVDAVWIVQSIVLPKPNPGLVDRVLVSAEAQEMDVGIVFNKVDIAKGPALDRATELRLLYRQLGYPVLTVSALTHEGLSSLEESVTGKLNIFTGPSGVGKTALLNALEPRLNLKTGDVSMHTRKGRHTTAHAELHLLTGGGGVVDTPGIREFGVLDIKPWELSHYFREFKRHVNLCRFAACTHDHEPGCQVQVAAKQGFISEERYRSYRNILATIQAGVRDVGR